MRNPQKILSSIFNLQDRSDYIINGYDFGVNFTLNICSPLIADYSEVTGVSDKSANVSGIYTDIHDNLLSLGATNDRPIFRGKRLVLEYTDGSRCAGGAYSFEKTTVISFLCDHELYLEPRVSFVGTSNECGFFFEFRTARACATVKVERSSLSPGGVFGVIFGVAVIVYMVGGCVYQRVVMQKSGWRQLPHYELWMGMVDWVLIVYYTFCTCCGRFGRKHVRLGSSGNSSSNDSSPRQTRRRSMGGQRDSYTVEDDEEDPLDSSDF